MIEDASSAQFVSSGHLLFARDGTVFAVPFDPERLEATGREMPVLSDVQMDIAAGQIGELVVSRNGTLAYVPGGQGFGEKQLAFVDRQGKTELIATAPGAYVQPRFSPDGTELAVVQRTGHVQHLALYDLSRNVQSQFTFEGSSNRAPVWSPDGSTIAFSSNREGQWNLFAKPVAGDASAVRLQQSDNIQRPSSWSPDGGLLLYGDRSPSDQLDVRLLPVDETSSQNVPLLTAGTNEIQARFAPMGGWIAYVSGEEGQPEVFVREFAREAIGSGRRTKVSRDGGWSRCGPPTAASSFIGAGTGRGSFR